jgi:hypothetical protein
MKNYSPRQKSNTPVLQSGHSGQKHPLTTNNRRDKNEEYYCGTRCDTFLPSVSDLPLPPSEWIDPNARSKSTPTSPIPKPTISATKSIDIASIFGTSSLPLVPNIQQQPIKNPTSLKASSYPGEKIRIDKQKLQNNQQQKGNTSKMNKKNKRNLKEKEMTAKESSNPKTATAKTSSSNTAVAAQHTTSAAAVPPPSTKSITVTLTGKEIGQDLMEMLGVHPPKSIDKKMVLTPNVKPFDYGCMARSGSPEKYKDITNNLKHLLKVQG